MYQNDHGNEILEAFRIFVRTQKGQWVDVTEKQAVLYGAGQGCFAFMNEMQLPKVCCVADSSESKWGKEIELLNTIYQIQPPHVLLTLEPEKHYIIITSKEHEGEIKESIAKCIGEEKFLLCNGQSIFFAYKQIDDMFNYDPLMKKGVLASNLSLAVGHIISLFHSITTMFNQTAIDRFIPSRGGESKLVFFFGNETELWVFSMPGLHNDWERAGIDRDRKSNRELRYALKERVDIDKKITVYEDKNGILIQNYAGEYIDFTREEVKKRVLRQCRKLHQIDEVIEIKNDMIERYFINLTEKALKRAAGGEGDIREAEKAMKKVVSMLRNLEYTPRICHCDLSCSNIVSYKGSLFFIDWEYMAMCDPMFDVCGFLFSVGLKLHKESKISYENALRLVYLQLKQDLFIYFKRNCTQQEYLRAFLVLLIFEYRELLGEALSTGTVDMKKKNFLLGRVDFAIYKMEGSEWI